MKFRKILKRELNDKKISQYKFSSMIGVSSTYVSDMTNGKKGPPKRELQQRIVEKLEMSDTEKENFFDEIANEKNDIPTDIYNLILNNKDKWNEIRKVLRDISCNGGTYDD